MDHQVDGYFLTLQQLHLLRLHMVRQSVVSQCINGVNREGSWHTHSAAASPLQYVLIQNGSWAYFLLALMVAVLGWYKWWRCSLEDART